MKTFGEAWYEVKREYLNISRKFDNTPSIQDIPHKKRMSREEANEVYRAKSRKYFGLEEFNVKDFESVEDYFDYHEALKFKKQLGIAS